MKDYLLFFLIFCFISKTFSLIIKCDNSNKNKEKIFPNLEKIKLGNNYAINIRYTNWINGLTGKFVEKNFNNSLLITKTTRNTYSELYAPFNSSAVLNKVNTSNLDHLEHNCHGQLSADELNIYEIPLIFKDFFNLSDQFSFGLLLSAVVESNKYYSSFSNTENITVGIETIGWVACANNISDNFSIQANVYFGAENSKKPYNQNFNNPQIFSIHLQSFRVTNFSTFEYTILDYLSFYIVTLDKVNLINKDFELALPRGKYCKNVLMSDIEHKLPTRFKGYLQYYDNNTIDNIEILYDKNELIFSFSANFQTDRDIPFIGGSSFNGNVFIVHDFKYGLQYTLSKNQTVCYGITAIDNKMGDVKVINETLFIRDPSEVLFNISQADFYYLGKVKNEGGIILDSFVSRKNLTDNGNELIIEILYVSKKWNVEFCNKPVIHSIVQYHTDNVGNVLRKTTIRFTSLIDYNGHGAFWLLSNVNSCFQLNKENEFFFISFGNVTLNKIKQVGLDYVKNSLIEAIAHVAKISVLRISNFMFTQLQDKILACFMISEKTEVDPAKTDYLQKEISIDEAREELNKTINNPKKINVPIGNNQGFLVISLNEFGQLQLHDSPQLIFNGYSSSSMFVLGLFMFIFGLLAVILPYIFYMKRQSIRGIAYQVFE